MSNTVIRLIISILAILAMIAHLKEWIKFSWEALALFGIAALPWLSEFIDTFKVGKDGWEFKLREIEKKADAAIDASLRGAVKKPHAAAMTASAQELKMINDADPQKGLWGGSPSSNSRLLSARIEKIPGEDYFRRVILRVESIDAAKPLIGKVTFHLHPTFNTPDFDIPVAGGVAETSVVSYGAFTVGAEADDGQTKLELNLAALNDGKDQFFNR